MLKAFGLGAIAQSSLLLAGLLVFWVTVPRRLVGAMAGFGAGALLAAVSFDLIAETEGLDEWELGLWMLVGVAVFLVGDRIVERRFGSEGTGGAMGIVVGSVVDGVPESIIFGIQLATGLPVSASFLAAVLISNVPQAIAPPPTSPPPAGVPAGSDVSGSLLFSPVAWPPHWGTRLQTPPATSPVLGWLPSPPAGC